MIIIYIWGVSFAFYNMLYFVDFIIKDFKYWVSAEPTILQNEQALW